MKLSNFSFKKLNLYIRKFEQSQNTVEAVFFLNEILNLLEKNKYNDERLTNYLNEICEKFNIKLGTNWKKIQLHIPGIDCYYSVNKILFIEDDLKKEILDNGETVLDRLQKNILLGFDWCDVLFGQTVPLHVVN